MLFDEKAGLIETWNAERCAGFFDCIDPLKDLFTDLQFHAPEVITIGQESTGKSTLMERLTGIPVFPRNADLCTRCVIKVRLRRGPAQDLKLLVEDLATGVEGAAKSISMGDVSDEVMREMTRQVRLEALRREFPGRAEVELLERLSSEPLMPSDGICTERVVVVVVTSPTGPNLDIADCPGLVAAAARGRPEDVVKTTASLVRKYAELTRDKALFIVTLRASDQPNNSLGMMMVQDLRLEPKTLGVLTMTDILSLSAGPSSSTTRPAWRRSSVATPTREAASPWASATP